MHIPLTKVVPHLFAAIALTDLIVNAHLYADLVLPAPPTGQYRLVFVTSTTTDATSTSIATYNSFVTATANTQTALVNLGTTWSVIGSTSAVSAVSNTMTDPSPAGATGVPIYRVDGVKVADHYDDLWDGSIQAAISITELGTNPAGNSLVWTGSAADPVFGVQPLGSTTPVVGVDSFTSGSWIQFGTSTPNTELRPLYALSGVLEGAAVPEPGAFLCTGLIGGLIGFDSLWRKRIRTRMKTRAESGDARQRLHRQPHQQHQE